MDWKTMLAYVTGSVDEEHLRRNEYLVAENRILRAQIPGRVPLSDGDRRTLAEIGRRLGRQALAEGSAMGVWSRNSCGRPVVKLQGALAALHGTGLAHRLAGKEEEVVLPLVIPLAVKVLDIRP